MTKYIIYAEDDEHPGEKNVVKKIKSNEYEALTFVGDVKNLAKYGYLTLIKKTDEKGDFTWDAQAGSWVAKVE